ncbi:MAG: hypothetical protein JJT82_02115 [Legionellaceae bacterium]|nr:hypothetical protein [Legionellaceae bacterium]
MPDDVPMPADMPIPDSSSPPDDAATPQPSGPSNDGQSESNAADDTDAYWKIFNAVQSAVYGDSDPLSMDDSKSDPTQMFSEDSGKAQDKKSDNSGPGKSSDLADTADLGAEGAELGEVAEVAAMVA